MSLDSSIIVEKRRISITSGYHSGLNKDDDVKSPKGLNKNLGINVSMID